MRQRAASLKEHPEKTSISQMAMTRPLRYMPKNNRPAPFIEPSAEIGTRISIDALQEHDKNYPSDDIFATEYSEIHRSRRMPWYRLGPPNTKEL